MTAPFQYLDAASLIGSWPISPTISGGAVTIDPQSLDSQATILSIRRETVAGYDVKGKSFFLWVDVASVPTQISISFAAGAGTLSLDDVIGEINTQASGTAGADVAFRDNGFLRLKSPNSGTDSYLRLETDSASSPADVFFELGLFSETIARGGQITQAQNIDPDRQVATPRQLSAMEGESLSDKVFNRLALQLAVNADLTEGVVGRKRIPVRKEISLNYASGSPEGISLAGNKVFTGTTTSPTNEQLKKYFAVLDADGNEFTQELETQLSTDANTDFIYDDINNEQRVVASAAIFAASDVAGQVFVKPADLASQPALNGTRLKIIRFVSTTEVIVDVGVEINESVRTIDRTLVTVERVEVDGVYNTAGGSRIEGLQAVKEAAIAVTRIEANNRVVASGAQFETNGVLVGDLVEYAGHLSTGVFENNGLYRVSRIIDEETLELVSEDWGAAFLNPDLSGGAGTVEVRTDGAFREDVFIRFDSTKAIPADTTPIRLVYLEQGDLRTATDDPEFFVGPGVGFDQEISTQTIESIAKIVGPSFTTVDDFLTNFDATINLEQIDTRLDAEHDEVGRHTDIEPDSILLRHRAGELPDDPKITLRNTGDTLTDFMMTNRGWIAIQSHLNGDDGVPRAPIELGAGLTMEINGEAPQNLAVSGAFLGFGTSWVADTYYFVVTAIDQDGNETVASNEDSQVIDNATFDIAVVTWDGVPGAAGYKVYAGTAPGVYDTLAAELTTPVTKVSLFGLAGGAASPPAVSGFHETKFGGVSSLFGRPLRLGRYYDTGIEALLNVTTDGSNEYVAQFHRFGTGGDAPSNDATPRVLFRMDEGISASVGKALEMIVTEGNGDGSFTERSKVYFGGFEAGFESFAETKIRLDYGGGEAALNLRESGVLGRLAIESSNIIVGGQSGSDFPLVIDPISSFVGINRANAGDTPTVALDVVGDILATATIQGTELRASTRFELLTPGNDNFLVEMLFALNGSTNGVAAWGQRDTVIGAGTSWITEMPLVDAGFGDGSRRDLALVADQFVQLWADGAAAFSGPLALTFTGTTLVPSQTEIVNIGSTATTGAKLANVVAGKGRFFDQSTVPVNSQDLITRNAQNVTVARGFVLGGVLQGDHWNVVSVAASGGGTAQWDVTLDQGVDTNSSILVTPVDASGVDELNVYAAHAEWISSTVFRVQINYTQNGSSLTTRNAADGFYFAIVGRPVTLVYDY